MYVGPGSGPEWSTAHSRGSLNTCDVTFHLCAFGYVGPRVFDWSLCTIAVGRTTSSSIGSVARMVGSIGRSTPGLSIHWYS